jgi:hypothetical protein
MASCRFGIAIGRACTYPAASAETQPVARRPHQSEGYERSLSVAGRPWRVWAVSVQIDLLTIARLWFPFPSSLSAAMPGSGRVRRLCAAIFTAGSDSCQRE